MDLEREISHIQGLVGDNNLTQAIDGIIKLSLDIDDKEVINSAILIRASFNENFNRSQKGLIEAEKEYFANNKIRDSILNFLVKIRTGVEKGILNLDRNIYKKRISNNNIKIKESTSTPVRVGNPPFNSAIRIIGRNKELEQLESYLSKDNSIAILSGIGGIGKTTLASEYYWKSIREKKYKYFRWIPFNDSIERSIDLVYRPLRHFYFPNWNDALDKHGIINFVLNKELNLVGQKLMVFDGVNDRKELNKLKVIFREFNNIIITTRSLSINKGNNTIRLFPLREMDALDLFYNNCPNFSRNIPEENSVKNLLNAVESHTLIVEIIAKKINKSSYLNPEKILSFIQKNQLDKLENQVSYLEDGDENSISNLINQIFSISSLNKREFGLLKLFSILPPVNFSFTQVIEFHGKNVSNIDDESDIIEIDILLSNLAGKGYLIKRENDFRCHQLIQQYILFQKTPFAHEFEELLIFLNSNIEIQEFDLPLIESELIQISYSLIDKLKGTSRSFSVLINNIGMYELLSGNGKKALALLEKAHDTISDLKDDEIGTRIKINTARTLSILGQNIEAESILLALLSSSYIQRSNSIEKVSLKLLLGRIYYRRRGAENLGLAIKTLQEALLLVRDLFPNEIKHNCYILHALGIAYRFDQDYKSAIEVLKKSIELLERNNLILHPIYLNSLDSLATIYDDIGSYGLSENLMKNAIAVSENIYPLNHPTILQQKLNLAATLMGQKKLEESAEYMDILERSLADESVPIAFKALFYFNKGNLKYENGFLEEALKLIFKARKMMVKELGEHHFYVKRMDSEIEKIEVELNSRG